MVWKLHTDQNSNSWNKSPGGGGGGGGLNAHLNWRKLPLVHIGVCYQLEKLHGGPSLGYFLQRAPSPTCYPPSRPLRPPWKLPRTIFILHLRRSKVEQYITLLFFFTGSGEEVWNLQSFGTSGPPPGPPWWPHVPYEHLWIPSPWGWFLPCLVKIQPCIFEKKMKQLFFLL